MCQRKAAKRLCYQNLLDAFFFETKAPKKKALQKRKGVFSPTRRAVAFAKSDAKQSRKVSADSTINQNLNLKNNFLIYYPPFLQKYLPNVKKMSKNHLQGRKNMIY